MLRGQIPTFLFVLLFLGQGRLCAEPSLEANLSREFLHTGETVLLNLDLRWPAEEGDYQFTFPEILTARLKVVRRGASEEVYREEGITWRLKTFNYVLEASAAGEGEIGPLVIHYVQAETGFQGDLKYAGNRIQVKASPVRRNFLWIGLTGALGAIVLSGIFLFVYRQKKRAARAPSEDLSREALAIRELAGCSEEKLLAQPREVLGCMSQIFRLYLGSLFPENPGIRSENDFRESVNSIAVEPDERRSLVSIFSRFQEFRYGAETVSAYELKCLRNDLIRYLEGKRVLGPAGSNATSPPG